MSDDIVGVDGQDGLIPDFTKMETQILEASLTSESTRQMSIRLQIPQTFIRTFLNKAKVKKFLREQKEIAAHSTQMKLQAVLTDIVETRIEELDGDISLLTRKDTLEVMKLLAQISGDIVKGEQQAEEQDKYALLLGKVMKDD